MATVLDKREEIKKILLSNFGLLEDLTTKINKIIKGKRDIMYSDIINLILREGLMGEKYTQIILWCNYKIRLGETFVEFK